MSMLIKFHVTGYLGSMFTLQHGLASLTTIVSKIKFMTKAFSTEEIVGESCVPAVSFVEISLTMITKALTKLQIATY